jgi:hypothetical protein
MSSNVHVDRGVVDVLDNEGQAGSETKSLYPIGTADEQQVGLPDLGGDQNDSLASADDLIESLRSGSSWSQGIRVDQSGSQTPLYSKTAWQFAPGLWLLW